MVIFTARKRNLRRLCFYRCLSFCPQGRGCYPSMPCSRSPGDGVLSQHALQVSRPTPGGGSSGGCGQGGLQAHTQGGSWGDLARGVSRPTPKGEVEGICLGGVSRPTPKGKLRGICLGGVSRPTPGGSPGPHLVGVYPSMHWGRPLPIPTATAAGGTHPTGMHSCCHFYGIDSSHWQLFWSFNTFYT